MKSPIPLNRYDDFLEENSTVSTPQRDRTPEPKIVARGLYNFVAQNNRYRLFLFSCIGECCRCWCWRLWWHYRELSFQKGDVIYVRRQIDKNWYEGEHNAMIGIFPVNYVEVLEETPNLGAAPSLITLLRQTWQIIPYDGIRMTLKKPSEGKGRVKYNFVAQTPVELCLVKGEMVIIMRQVDEHWMEGRIGHRKGIFPISYIDVIQPPGDRQGKHYLSCTRLGPTPEKWDTDSKKGLHGKMVLSWSFISKYLGLVPKKRDITKFNHFVWHLLVEVPFIGPIGQLVRVPQKDGELFNAEVLTGF